MLISEICTITHTRMGLGSLILPSKVPMRGQYGFFIAKFSNVMAIFYFNYDFYRLSLLFS